MVTHSVDTAARPDGDGTGEGDIPASVIEDLLSSRRRRRILTCLYDCGEPVPVDDLATELAAYEDGTDPEAVSRDRRREVRTDIYQTQLPKLTATGAVAFDSILGTVEFGGDEALAARVEALFEGPETKDK